MRPIRILVLVGAAFPGLALATSNPPPPTYQTTVHGTVFPYTTGYNSNIGAGRPVTVQVTPWSAGTGTIVTSGGTLTCQVCVAGTVATYNLATDSNGAYSVTADTTNTVCSAPNTGNSACGDRSRSTHIVVTSPGFETTINIYDQTPNVTPPTDVLMNLTQAPNTIADDGKYFTRRIGNGAWPIFLIEGFDPIDAMHSDYLTTFLQKAYMPDYASGNGHDFADYLTNNGYSIYLLLSGPNGAASIAGRDANNNITGTTGMAFSAMSLIKKTKDQYHPNNGAVVGGYSQGGVVAMAGLSKWCNGSFAAANSLLAANCPEVNLWFAGDAPLQGATAAVSLQRYLNDLSVTANLGSKSAMIAGFTSSWAAREMLKQRIDVTNGHCDTSCISLYGCNSYEPNFTGGNCTLVTNDNTAFSNWMGHDVLRSNGTRLPGVAFSMGSTPNQTSSQPASPFMHVAVDWAGDQDLWPGDAGGTSLEYGPGSKLSMVYFIGQAPDNQIDGFLWWNATVYLNYYPTFIPTVSSLNWGYQGNWKSYWYESFDQNHTPPISDLNQWTSYTIPNDAVGFLINWIWTYTKGNHVTPVCSSKTIYTGRGGTTGTTCRTPVCGDGICEGDLGNEGQCNCPADCGYNILCTTGTGVTNLSP